VFFDVFSLVGICLCLEGTGWFCSGDGTDPLEELLLLWDMLVLEEDSDGIDWAKNAPLLLKDELELWCEFVEWNDV
jgi:hypothetical protein